MPGAGGMIDPGLVNQRKSIQLLDLGWAVVLTDAIRLNCETHAEATRKTVFPLDLKL